MTNTPQQDKPTKVLVREDRYESTSYAPGLWIKVVDKHRVEIFKQTWPAHVPVYGGKSYCLRMHWVNGVLSNVSSYPWEQEEDRQ